jgi:heme-degrading monooxygenase HmoA
MAEDGMVATVWSFRIRPEAAAAFERCYGPGGDWARLFARADGFASTELLRQESDPARYLTIDRWRSTEAFERARTRLAGEYAALDAACEAWTLEETWLGLHRVLA